MPNYYFPALLKKKEVYHPSRDKTGLCLLDVTGEEKQKDTHGNARNRIQVVQYIEPFSNVYVLLSQKLGSWWE